MVTGKFAHEAEPGRPILQIELTDGTLIRGVTENHPFWSEDRHKFVPAGELSEGEQVRAGGGLATIASVLARNALPGEKLYNLEIHNEHVYQVTTAGVLVHNAYRQLAYFCARPNYFRE